MKNTERLKLLRLPDSSKEALDYAIEALRQEDRELAVEWARKFAVRTDSAVEQVLEASRQAELKEELSCLLRDMNYGYNSEEYQLRSLKEAVVLLAKLVGVEPKVYDWEKK